MRATHQLDAASVARNPVAVAQAVQATRLSRASSIRSCRQRQDGYSVAIVVIPPEDGDFRRVTVVGNLGGLEVGSTIRALGGFEKHPRFGEQFHVVDFETLRPAGAVAIERYLASEIKGIGPRLARRIAEHFGDTLGEVLDNAPERMREVPGIGGAVARLIATAWRDASGSRELTVFLRGHGLCGVARSMNEQVLRQGTRST